MFSRMVNVADEARVTEIVFTRLQADIYSYHTAYNWIIEENRVRLFQFSGLSAIQGDCMIPYP